MEQNVEEMIITVVADGKEGDGEEDSKYDGGRIVDVNNQGINVHEENTYA